MRETVHFIELPADHSGYEYVMIVGPKSQIETYLDHSWSEEDRLLFEAPLSSIKSEEKGGTVSTFIQDQRVFLCALPTQSTRMNSPARPDVLSTFLYKSTPKEGRTLVILCPLEEEHIESLLCATARAYPRFSKKVKSERPAIDLAICSPESLISESEERGGTQGELLDRLEMLSRGVQQAAAWVDQPPAHFHVPQFIEAARNIAVQTKSEIDVFEGTSLMQMGLEGVWAVGRAAVHPPALVVLRGPQSTPDAPQMVWVGKGVIYDTGGLSLKPKGTMGGMKMDMGGAAGVLAAFEVAAAYGQHTDLCAVLCLAENAIGSHAFRNDDILTLYSGKTVEINNTDAEGRLLLGDGVAYATHHLNPEVVIDMATLTGAQLMATGQKHAGIVCNRERLEQVAVLAGRRSGDLVHPLPYCPEFFQSEFKSEVADMKNSVRDRMNAQSSCAAHFVESHLGDYQGQWLHIDIAGPAFRSDRGTGFGVALLNELAGEWRRGNLS